MFRNGIVPSYSLMMPPRLPLITKIVLNNSSFIVALCRNHHQPMKLVSLQASLQHDLVVHRTSFGCFLQPGNLEHRSLRFKNSNKNTSRPYYKSSEESDITEEVVDSLSSADGSAEAILVQGNQQNASPWWKQFPRRWVIVLLCFASFLLCNMDRVSVYASYFLHILTKSALFYLMR